MTQQRLRLEQIRVGEPLPFDTYDGAGRLLLRRGALIETAAQIERLVDQGLFQQADDDVQRRLVAGYMPSYAGRKVSVLDLLGDARVALHGLLLAPDRPDLAAAVLDIARVIQRACRLDPDAAVGNIVTSRSTFYPARHAVNCAVVCSLILGAFKAADDVVSATLCAALTMNLTIVDLQHALYSRSTPLSAGEETRLRTHPTDAAARLRAIGVGDELWLQIVAQHHELADGTGYPDKLAGDAIVRYARVVALVDQYCALVSERARRDGLNPAAVIAKLRHGTVAMFDPTVTTALVHVLGLYPPGSVVELTSGEIGVVAHRGSQAAHPIVMSYISSHHVRYPEPRKRLSSQPGGAIAKHLPQGTLQPYPIAESLWHAAFEPEALQSD